MMKDTELAEAVRSLRAQSASLQAQHLEVLRVLQDQAATMKNLQRQSAENVSTLWSITKQFQAFQLHAIENQFPRRTMLSEMKPDPLLNAHDLVLSSTLKIAPSFRSSLFDLNTMATKLIGDNEEASDLIGEVEKLVDLVSATNLVGDEANVEKIVEI